MVVYHQGKPILQISGHRVILGGSPERIWMAESHASAEPSINWSVIGPSGFCNGGKGAMLRDVDGSRELITVSSNALRCVLCNE